MTAAAEEAPDAHLISTVTRIENTICVTVIGQLDLEAEDELTEIVSQALSTPEVVAVHLDLTAISFIDSSGLRVLIQASELAREHDLAFTIDLAATGPVTRLLALTGLHNHFTQATIPVPT
jgi:anti-anti-sigma factor